MRLLLVLSLAAALAQAADFSGKWTGSAEAKNPDGNQHSESIYLNLKQSGDQITGVLGSQSGQEFEISQAKADGDTLSFVVQPGEDAPAWSVKLTLSGDSLTGDASAERDGQTLKGHVNLRRST